MSGRPSLLWVTEEVPDRDGGGGNIRQANLLVELARHLDIDLLVTGSVTDPEVREAARTVTEVAVTAPPPARSRLRALRTLLVERRPLAVAAAAGAVAALRPLVEERSAGHDLALVHHATLAPLLPAVRGAVRVAHPHNVGSVSSAQAAAVAERWPARLLLQADARAARHVERRLVADADVLLTCSQEDADALVPRPGPAAPQVVVAPNGVDLARFHPTPIPGSRRVLFFGSLDFPPNVDGITWFADAVWPAVRAAVDGAELAIVGRNPTAAVRALAGRPGVHVAGDVPSSAPWYESSDAVVVPLRFGTGTRLKALEAMAAARPTIGTAIGLDGLGLVEAARRGEPAAAVVDDEAGLAAEVVRCLTDRAHAESLAAAGRAHVERHYGWAVIADALAERLAGLTGRPPKQRA